MALNQLIAANFPKTQLTGPGIQPMDKFDATYKFEDFIGQIIGVLTIVAVLFFVVQVIFAGYAFIASQGDEKTMEATRKRLTEAVLGLTIVIVALGLANLIAALFGIRDVLDISGLFTRLGL